MVSALKMMMRVFRMIMCNIICLMVTGLMNRFLTVWFELVVFDVSCPTTMVDGSK